MNKEELEVLIKNLIVACYQVYDSVENYEKREKEMKAIVTLMTKSTALRGL